MRRRYRQRPRRSQARPRDCQATQLSLDASQQAASGSRDQCTIAGDEEFESAVAVVSRGTGDLARDPGPACVRAERDGDPLVAQWVSQVQLDAAYPPAAI